MFIGKAVQIRLGDFGLDHIVVNKIKKTDVFYFSKRPLNRQDPPSMCIYVCVCVRNLYLRYFRNVSNRRVKCQRS